MHQPIKELLTEAWDPAIPDLATLSPIEVARVMNEADKTVALAVESVLEEIGEAIATITQALSHGGRLLYVGAGTSGRLGILDAAECPPTFNTDPALVQAVIAGGSEAVFSAKEGAEDDFDQGGQDLKDAGTTSQDVVVGITASGTTPYVLGALKWARENRIATVALACNQASGIELWSDITIALDTGPEVLMGSTRLKAGSAQKMVLNMLSTGVMVGLGKTFRNLMVDMRPTNEKLKDRAIRIVSLASGVSLEKAGALLEEAQGESKVAIAMALWEVSGSEARVRLSELGGILSKATPSRQQKGG